MPASHSDQNNDRNNGHYMVSATSKGSAGYSLRSFLNIEGKVTKDLQSTFQDSDWVIINLRAFKSLEN